MRVPNHHRATRVAVLVLLAGLASLAARARTRHHDPHAHPNGPHQTLPYMQGDPLPPVAMPTVPLAPPPAPVLPPPLVVPTRKPAPPPPPAVQATAPGTADHLPDGMRITFGADSADLNPETDAALRALAKAEPAGHATFNVAAHAAPTPDDPSTARRLSLSRALAVRAVLIQSGIASPHIYVRALGGTEKPPAGVTPDRVDIVVTVAPPPQKATP